MERSRSGREPWRYSVRGVSAALRVTPRGGRDDIDGMERLADGRDVLKLRVRAIAAGGETNRAAIELLAKALRVPRSQIRLVAGATSRLKQVEISGDPGVVAQKLASVLRRVHQASF